MSRSSNRPLVPFGGRHNTTSLHHSWAVLTACTSLTHTLRETRQRSKQHTSVESSQTFPWDGLADDTAVQRRAREGAGRATDTPVPAQTVTARRPSSGRAPPAPLDVTGRPRGSTASFRST